MTPPLLSRFSALRQEFTALAQGTWAIFRQEVAGKATLTRQQTVRITAGAAIALSSILSLLAGLTLLLTALLVNKAGWTPLLSGAVSALFLATLAASGGYLMIRSSRDRLKQEGFQPLRTLQSLKTAAATLTNQPLIPNPTTPHMNTRQNLEDAMNDTAATVAQQARRTSRAVQDNARSVADQIENTPLFASILSWIDALLTPQNRALAGRTLTSLTLLPRRHPAFTTMLGLSGLYLLFEKTRSKSMDQIVRNYADDASSYANDIRDSAVKGYKATADAGRDLRGAVYETADHVRRSGYDAVKTAGNAATETASRVRSAYNQVSTSVEDGYDQLSETAAHLRKDAEAGLRKARDFAKEEPALAIAGGLALTIGALLLLKSSRR